MILVNEYYILYYMLYALCFNHIFCLRGINLLFYEIKKRSNKIHFIFSINKNKIKIQFPLFLELFHFHITFPIHNKYYYFDDYLFDGK